MYFKVSLALAFMLATSLVFAQKSSKWAAVGQVYHQDVGVKLDFGSLQTTDAVSLRPGGEFGIERTWLEGKRVRLFQRANLGFWNSPYSENYAYIGTNLGLDVRVFKQLRITPNLIYRAGRAKTKDIRYVYENGKWVSSGNLTPGFFRNNVGLDMQLSWRFVPASEHPIDLQVGGNYILATKYFPVSGGTDIGPNIFIFRALHVGARYGL